MAYFYLLKQLWHYAQGHRWKIIIMVIFHVISMVAVLFNPYIFAQILNTLQLAERDAIMPVVTRWTLLWIAMFLIFNIFHRLGRYFEFDAAFKAKQNFLNRHYHAITHLSLQWHSNHHSGDTINRINMASGSLQSFGNTQFIYINYFMSFWGPLVALMLLSWEVALAALLIAVSSMGGIRYFDKALVTLYRQVNDTQHKLAAILYDYVSNIRTIITLRVGQKTQEHFDSQITAAYYPYMRAETWVNAWKWFCVSAATTVLRIGIVFYYIWLQVSGSGRILIGNAAAVFQYLQQLSDSYMNIAREYQAIIAWKTNYEAALSILSDYEQEHRLDAIPVTDWQHIALNDLRFSYDGTTYNLDGVNLSLQRGERIALIGESGSGKSSLMHVLRGLYKPSHVNLQVDGNTYTDLSPLQDTTTLIPQDPEIFENTILYNITMGLDYDRDLINRMITLACFDDVVKKLPHGLDTDVREKGVTLSGGEKQRLALARGLLAAQNSSIILLDEPTSSVDMHNEAKIYQGAFRHFKEQVIISSIHRVNLLDTFDRIVIMDQGQIIETGRYSELTANPASHLARYLNKIKQTNQS